MCDVAPVSAIQCASACVLGKLARRTLALAASSVTLTLLDGADNEEEEVVAQFARRGVAPSRWARHSLLAFCASLRTWSCDAYSVCRVWTGRRQCENMRRYNRNYYAPGAAGDGVRTSADGATRCLAPGLYTWARVTCYKVQKHTMRATGTPVHAKSMLPQAPTPTQICTTVTCSRMKYMLSTIGTRLRGHSTIAVLTRATQC
jgi:hypothetical protein